MGIVVTYAVDEGLTQHEVAARVAVARSLAALKGFEFGGGYDSSLRRSERSSALYFVPSETLSGDEAARLGIRGADDLFGGVVPWPFVATKTITHPLASREAQRSAYGGSDLIIVRVLRGRDARGRRHCGVLEQSWRIGGASGPEVAALEAFRADPGLRARVHFRGVDPQAGPLVKYTIVEPHGTAH